DPEPWRKLGQHYLASRQPFEAMWALEEALERGPGDAPTVLNLAGALEAAGLYRSAMALLSDLLRRDPGNLPARERLAGLHLRLGEAQPAITVVQNAGERLAAWPEGWLTLGRARQLAGDLPGA